MHYACLYASMITSTMTHRFTSNFGYNLKPILDPWNFLNDFLILHSYAIVNVLGYWGGMCSLSAQCLYVKKVTRLHEKKI